MSSRNKRTLAIGFALVAPLLAASASAQKLSQPPGANLTYGDVTHGMRAQSASTNPAAAAADLARQDGAVKSGTVVSAAAGLEYGNIQQLWDFYDEISQAYRPSEDDAVYPGQLPETKPPGGIDLGQIWDLLDPDIEDELDAIVSAVSRQAVLLGLIAAEGYGKAWRSVDIPVAFATPRFGGAWTLQLQWSGTARGFGLAEPIDFDAETARAAIQDWFDTEIGQRAPSLVLGGQTVLLIDALGNVRLSLQNDSAIAYKSAQLSTLSTGYSREAWSNGAGTLFLGGEMHLHNMRMSRLGVRFGDITDSDELFDAIDNANFESDTRLSFDAGLLWVGNNYQVGAQLTNLNAPRFKFPDIDISPFRSATVIGRLQRDRTYTMERQLKLEASIFGNKRKWSAHMGLDANEAKDPVGDDFQWFTVSTGFDIERRWLPNLRLGYRQNLVGTKKKYVGLGMTIFEYVNIDIASALNTTRIDGRKLPEGLMFSMGFQVNW